MSKHVLLLGLWTFFCFCDRAFAQQKPVTPFSFNSIPASPQATEMTKYGGIPVNLSTGAPDYGIPLYSTNVANNLKLDVSLHYNTNGIKVQELSGVAGVGWSLFAGGVISRTVNDDPDELSTDLANPLTRSTAAERNITWFDDNPLKRMLWYGNAEFYDMQPDLFSYNFFGHIGQFYIDSGAAYIIDYEDIKIEMNFQATAAWNFKVTDQFGNIFYFGSPAATEITEIHNVATNLVGEHDQWNPSTTNRTAWYLTKVETPTGEIVTFEYAPSNFTASSISRSTQLDRSVVSSVQLGSTPCNCVEPIIESRQTRLVNSFILKKITFNNVVQLDFDHINNVDLMGTYLVSNIKVKDLATSYIFKQINFSYEFPTNSKRPFLLNLSNCSGANNQCDLYTFDYERRDQFPARTEINKEDYYGYFNNGGNFTDNRGVNCLATQIGMLNKVTYPTGGSETITYGCAQSTDSTLVTQQINGAYISGYGTSDHSPVDYSQQFIVPPGTIDILLFGNAIWHSDPAFPPDINMHQIFVSVYNKRTNETLPFPQMRVQANNFDSAHVYNFLPGDTLILKLTSFGDKVEGQAQLDYKKKVWIPVTSFYGASKVEKLTIFDPVSQKTNVKKYVYEFKDQPGVSSGKSINSPWTTSSYYFRNVCDYNIFSTSKKTCLYNMRSDYSQYDLYSYMPSSYLYSSVLEYDGPNGENGLTEHLFDLRLPSPSNYSYYNNLNIPLSYNDVFETPYSLYGGVIARGIGTNYYRNNGSGYSPVKKERKWFSVKQSLKKRLGYGVRVVDAGNPGHIDQTLEIKGDVKQFTYESTWTVLDSIVSTDYTMDGNNTKNTVAYRYDNIQHCSPTLIQTNKGDGAEQYLVNIYPWDYIGASDYILKMQQAHVNAYPLEQVSLVKKNGEFKITGGVLTQYAPNVPSLLTKQYKLKLSASLPLSGFKLSNRTSGSDLFSYTKQSMSKDSRYISFNEHTRFTLQYKPSVTINEKGERTNYMWSFKGRYLSAVIENADDYDDGYYPKETYSYTSFEDGDNTIGNWQWNNASFLRIADPEAPTGKYVYKLPTFTTDSRPGLDPARTYLLTFYFKGPTPSVLGATSSRVIGTAGPYQLFEATISGTTQTEITFPTTPNDIFIDELRLCPIESRMKTFTYSPDVGLTSECDESGNIKKYFYDARGRLITVKDRNNNILKQVDYQVQGPQ
ncbi:hypothetical protein [Sphingobacterium sp. DR205]|uniref:hypothetical protein n=1 Tax=Sphingobacterium sp. DR205 TaxID=2713573 RepID=UPI0013E46B38|nr:hypothetical protein [Sphingobacterium sp. DR205]QIH33488.1 hypothetical protein G6053_11585 [Sphingobacterium sp. DR205]